MSTVSLTLLSTVAIQCRRNRGNLFLANESTTWENVGAYDLGFNPQVEDSGLGYYGYDKITLNGHVVPDQVIAIVKDTRYWLGYMGLGIKETNFKDANKLTLLSSLVQNQSLIPSHSYGYTAGASYRESSFHTFWICNSIITVYRFERSTSISYTWGCGRESLLPK